MLREMFCDATVLYEKARMLGVICILSAGGGIALLIIRDMKKRLQQMKELYQIMSILKGEMSYRYVAIPEALIHSGERIKGTCGLWAIETGIRMNQYEGKTLGQIWDLQVDKLSKKAALMPADIDELRRVGRQMSAGDKETQVLAIERYLQYIQDQERLFMHELPGKIKLSLALSMLAAAFIVVILI